MNLDQIESAIKRTQLRHDRAILSLNAAKIRVTKVRRRVMTIDIDRVAWNRRFAEQCGQLPSTDHKTDQQKKDEYFFFPPEEVSLGSEFKWAHCFVCGELRPEDRLVTMIVPWRLDSPYWERVYEGIGMGELVCRKHNPIALDNRRGLV